jgi:hypothetical protein
MCYYLTKLLISAAIIVAVTEVAKTNAALAGLIKSLKLVAIMVGFYLLTFLALRRAGVAI